MAIRAARLGSDDRARFVECLDTATVTVVHDDIRAAVDGLSAAAVSVRTAGDRAGEQHAVEVLLSAVDRLHLVLWQAPDADVAECPGRMVVVEAGVWRGHLCESARCDVCGRQVSD